MEQEEARRKLEEGGVMLCMGVPQGTELHCDMAGLVVGPKFRGIKMLPPGLHLFCWDAGQDKHATILVFPRGHVETWQWNPQNEDMEPVADNDERERLVYAVRNHSFDRELGQYPEDANRGWPRISYLITCSTLQRMGLSGGVTTSSSAEQTTFDREFLRDAPVKAVFTTLQLARRCDGMSPQEVSEYNMDGTMRLVDTLRNAALVSSIMRGPDPPLQPLAGTASPQFVFACSNTLQAATDCRRRHRMRCMHGLIGRALTNNNIYQTWRELLAEVQMAFILFLTAASFDGLEFWKQAVALLCSCGKGFYRSHAPHAPCVDAAAASTQGHTAEDHLEMMSEFIRVLRRQLEHVPADFFRDELAKVNFLGPALAALLQLGEAATSDLKAQPQHDAPTTQGGSIPLLERRLRRLKSLLAQRFELAEDDLDADLLGNHEDAPAIVTAPPPASACVDVDDEPRASASAAPPPPASVPRMSWMLEPPS